MLIPSIGGVNNFNSNKSIISVNATRNISSPSFGYSLANRPYEREALKFLRDHFPILSEAVGRSIKFACRNKESAAEITDHIMDKGVILAEKLGFVYHGNESNPLRVIA